MRVALAQFAPSLGDLEANLAAMGDLVARANAQDTDLVVFPELATHGYALGHVPAELAMSAADPRLTALSSGRADILACLHEDGGIRTYNSATYMSRTEVVHVHRKLYLSNYLDWEERKHASPGQELRAFNTAHARTATLICNDVWQPPLPWLAAQDGAELLLVPADSAANLADEAVDNRLYWGQLIESIGRMQQLWVVFVNRVGTEDGAQFWGGSRVVDPHGDVIAQAAFDEPELLVVDIDIAETRRSRRRLPLNSEARLGLIEREARRLIQAGGDA